MNSIAMMSGWPALVLAAEAGGDAGDYRALRVFAAVAVLVILALLATSERAWKLQRNRLIAPLISGGWLALIVGIVLGPFGLRLVDDQALLEVRPLLLMGLGWIGVLVGMQAQRRILKAVPNAIWRWVAVDAVVMLLTVAFATWIILHEWIPSPGAHLRLAPITLMVAAAFGWAAETRSIMTRRSPERLELAAFVRGGSGLSAMIAIVVFGLVTKFVRRNEEGLIAIFPIEAFVNLIASAALAVLVGLVGRFMLQQAGRRRPDMLVVFIGIVAVVTGVAAEYGYSPLFSAMLAGAVIANLQSAQLREFERFILKAEQTVGVLFALLAGVLLDPRLGFWGIILAIVVAVIRLSMKTPIMRWSLREYAPHLPRQSPLYSAPIRQAMVALALGVALVLAESSPFHRRLLAVIALIGIISEPLPIMLSWFWRWRGAGEKVGIEGAGEGSGLPTAADAERGTA